MLNKLQPYIYIILTQKNHKDDISNEIVTIHIMTILLQIMERCLYI